MSGTMRSGLFCACCGKELLHQPWHEIPPDGAWRDLAAADRHAKSLGRILVKTLRKGFGDNPDSVRSYSYIMPGQKPGYERNGAFCTLRCGFRFGLASHAAGYRLVANGGGA